jgi:hypothetical protein
MVGGSDLAATDTTSHYILLTRLSRRHISLFSRKWDLEIVGRNRLLSYLGHRVTLTVVRQRRVG